MNDSANPRALGWNIFHETRWRRFLSAAYGYGDHSWEDNGSNANLPLMLAGGIAVGRRFLLALPFSDQVEPQITLDSLPKLCAHVDHIMKETRAAYVEIKGVTEELLPRFQEQGYLRRYDNARFLLDLSQSTSQLLTGLHQNIRRNLRKPVPFDLFWDDKGERLEEFHRLHQWTMKQLGTPPHDRRFFALMPEHLGKSARFLHAVHQGRSIAALLFLLDTSRRSMRYVAGSSVPLGRELNATTHLFWEAIQCGQREGFRFLDFGVSRPGSGVWEFKRKWCAAPPQPVHYLVKGANDPIDPRQAGISLASRMWRDHMPMAIANHLGPWLRGQLGR